MDYHYLWATDLGDSLVKGHKLWSAGTCNRAASCAVWLTMYDGTTRINAWL